MRRDTLAYLREKGRHWHKGGSITGCHDTGDIVTSGLDVGGEQR